MTRLTADLFPRRGRHPNRKTSEYSAIRNMRSVAVCDPYAFVITERAGAAVGRWAGLLGGLLGYLAGMLVLTAGL